VIGDAPLELGAIQVRATEELPAVATRLPGGFGVAAAVMARTLPEKSPTPTLFFAATRNICARPLVRPVTVIDGDVETGCEKVVQDEPRSLLTCTT